jgi:hypothetical protein
MKAYFTILNYQLTVQHGNYLIYLKLTGSADKFQSYLALLAKFYHLTTTDSDRWLVNNQLIQLQAPPTKIIWLIRTGLISTEANLPLLILISVLVKNELALLKLRRLGAYLNEEVLYLIREGQLTLDHFELLINYQLINLQSSRADQLISILDLKNDLAWRHRVVRLLIQAFETDDLNNQFYLTKGCSWAKFKILNPADYFILQNLMTDNVN